MNHDIPLSPGLKKFLDKYKEFKQLAFDLGLNVKDIEIDHITKDGQKLIKEIELRKAMERS